MSVLIKDVDKELYKRFKAKAVMQGIKVGTALSLAMEKWLKDEEVNDDSLKRALNRDALKNAREKLISENAGRWALFSEGELIGTYTTKNNVFDAIEENQLVGKYNLISEIDKPHKRTVRLGLRRRKL